jgi:nicotinamide mononucleotide transporter
MRQYTDASLPYLDATLAVASLIAQWFLSKKILENWIIWISVDIFSIGMYWYKGLYVTA